MCTFKFYTYINHVLSFSLLQPTRTCKDFEFESKIYIYIYNSNDICISNFWLLQYNQALCM